MSQPLLSLHSALMTGSEPTFDGQPMQPGLHFRWSFAPKLGFPPGGFWLCRRPSRLREECIEPPEALIWDREIDPCIPPGSPTNTWGQPDWERWQIFGEPFVLPITAANWPARYVGAPNPSAADVVTRDIAEAQHRLGTLQLEPGVDNVGHLSDLRNTLARLLGGFPSIPLFEQLLEQSPDPSAPQFKVTLMEQLLMLAVNPRLAKVLGLYAVLPFNAAEEPFDYCLVGRWGNISSRLIPDRPIGTLYGVFPQPRTLSSLLAPATPVLTLRQRQAEIVDQPVPPKLVPFCLLDAAWDAPERNNSKDPMIQVTTDVPPNEPIGFIAERLVGDRAERLSQIIPPISQPRSKDDLKRVYRLFDRCPDPVAPLRYRVVGFNAFGMLGAWSSASNPLTILPSAATPQLQVINFDNSVASGGSQSSDPVPSWRGGTLHLSVNVSGADLYHNPNTQAVQLLIEQLQPNRAQLLTQTLSVDKPTILSVSVTQIQLAQIEPGTGKPFTLITVNPALSGVPVTRASAFLILMGQTADGLPIVDRYTVRLQPSQPNVLKVSYAANSHLAKNPGAFINRPAYLVLGYSQDLTLALPSLLIPANLPSVKCRVAVQGVTQSSQLMDDPEDAKFPVAAKSLFTAPQRWIPPQPPQPTLPTPTHIVHHEYFDPPDFYAQARISKLPFTTPPLPDNGGYLLLRAPIANLFLTDLKRRISLKQFADATPALSEADGKPRTDLTNWINLLPEWLAVYNERRKANKLSVVSQDNILTDSDGQRSFIEHFYGGLLDDELRELANVSNNLSAFTRVSSEPLPARGSQPLSDTIEGKGFGRVLYKVRAVSKATNQSQPTLAAGPYYTRITTPPQSPVIIKANTVGQAVILVWTLSDDPEIAGYLIYRGDSPEALHDVRFFGTGTGAIDLSKLATLNYQPTQWRSLSFGTGEIDPRIIALMPDPRLFARDYDGSNMAEVILPVGIVPTEILGVYRASEFLISAAPETQPQAFNYFRPLGKGGISQLVTDSTQARITGLRVGLGRPVEVVVVVRVNGEIRVLGALPVRRASFFDGGSAGHPVDSAALPNQTPLNREHQNVYAIVAVDRFGNRSQPSKPFVVLPF